MATAVRVTARVPGSRRAGLAEHEVSVGVPVGPVSVRALIEAVVRAEVTAFQARAEENEFVRVLTEASLAEAVERGAVRTGGGRPAPAVDPDQAVATALTAFCDGLYYLLIDEEQVSALDGVVQVGPDTRLLFLRLVPLAGG